MNRYINIELVDPYINRTELFPDEIRNIINKFGDRKISHDEILNAFDVLMMYLYQNDLYRISLDIDERNKRLEPAKEMTLEEIEKELGYKVKVVNEKGE